jgi:hypothetical protein
MPYASHEVNSTVSVGMDITNDLSQQNSCNIIIERGELRVERIIGTGRFLDDSRPGISPTYIRWLTGRGRLT